VSRVEAWRILGVQAICSQASCLTYRAYQTLACRAKEYGWPKPYVCTYLRSIHDVFSRGVINLICMGSSRTVPVCMHIHKSRIQSRANPTYIRSCVASLYDLHVLANPFTNERLPQGMLVSLLVS